MVFVWTLREVIAAIVQRDMVDSIVKLVRNSVHKFETKSLWHIRFVIDSDSYNNELSGSLLLFILTYFMYLDSAKIKKFVKRLVDSHLGGLEKDSDRCLHKLYPF